MGSQAQRTLFRISYMVYATEHFPYTHHFHHIITTALKNIAYWFSKQKLHILSNIQHLHDETLILPKFPYTNTCSYTNHNLDRKHDIHQNSLHKHTHVIFFNWQDTLLATRTIQTTLWLFSPNLGIFEAHIFGLIL